MDDLMAVLDDLNESLLSATDRDAVASAFDHAIKRLLPDLEGRSPTEHLSPDAREAVKGLVLAEEQVHHAIRRLWENNDRDATRPLWVAIEGLHRAQESLGLNPLETFAEFHPEYFA